MNFKDMWATDAKGNRFVFTVEMQRKLSEQGLPVDPASVDLLDRGGRKTPPVQKRSPRPARPASAPARSSVSPPARAPQSEVTGPPDIQIDAATGKYLGQLKWYNAFRGYGFIARGAGEDIFFHRSDVLVDPETLQEGQWVLYDVEEADKGLEANDVEPYSKPEGNP